jgi:DNA-binding NarL/FixJ family response regulator
MPQSAVPKKNTNRNDPWSSRPQTPLLSERQWLYIRERYRISPRELQVAKLTCQGLTDKEVAKNLKIQRGTVKVHLRNIYRRVRVRSKISLLLRFVGDSNHLVGRYSSAR